MAADTLKLLEFSELLDLICRYLGGPLGHSALHSLVPGENRSAAERRLALAAEAIAYLRSQHGDESTPPQSPSAPLASVSFSGFGDPSSLLAKLGVEGVVLELSELASLL